MNYKNWSLKNEIQRRVNLEDLHRWATRKENPVLPVYLKEPKQKWNLSAVVSFAREFRP